MPSSVYIETTIISYLTAKPSRDLIVAAHQQTTSEWWAKVRQTVECFVSPFVIDEAGRGDDVYARKRLEAIANFPVLQVNKEIEALAQQYFAALDIPEKAKIDAFHLAVAAWHKMDYVLSWNCKHIASGRVQKMLQDTNARLGIYTPIVCTPEELMEV
jgi:PIN domain